MFRRLLNKIDYSALKYPVLGAIAYPIADEFMVKGHAKHNSWDVNRKQFESQEGSDAIVNVINQAFKDMGCNSGPLHIHFPKYRAYEESSFNMTTVPVSLFDRSAGTIVKLHGSASDFQNYVQLYSFAGHEAVHHQHNHALVQSASMGFSFGYILASLTRNLGSKHAVGGIILLYAGQAMVSKLCEMDADITSALKLNTAAGLSSTIQKAEEKAPEYSAQGNKLMSNDLMRPYPIVAAVEAIASPLHISDHPSAKTRTFYLGLLSQGIPLLFQSDVYKTLTSKQSEENGHLQQANRLRK